MHPLEKNSVRQTVCCLSLHDATWAECRTQDRSCRSLFGYFNHGLLGMPGKVIAQLMGHAKVDTTLNVYAQVLDASVRETAERVGSRLITIDHTASEVAATTH